MTPVLYYFLFRNMLFRNTKQQISKCPNFHSQVKGSFVDVTLVTGTQHTVASSPLLKH